MGMVDSGREKIVMLMGETLSGKSSLIRALGGEGFVSHRAMAVEFFGRFINTPGEFLENPRFACALITTSADCDIIAVVQDATRCTSQFPPLFTAMFNRKVVGVITKIDASNAKIERAELFLRNAGVKDIVCTSSVTGAGLDQLREKLS